MNYKKIYFDYFGYGEQDFIYDEYEFIVNNKIVMAVDIHHIENRGSGGSKNKDFIENLMALSRKNHINFGDKKQFKDKLKEIHLIFMNNNPV